MPKLARLGSGRAGLSPRVLTTASIPIAPGRAQVPLQGRQLFPTVTGAPACGTAGLPCCPHCP